MAHAQGRAVAKPRAASASAHRRLATVVWQPSHCERSALAHRRLANSWSIHQHMCREADVCTHTRPTGLIPLSRARVCVLTAAVHFSTLLPSAIA
eukprot:365808-Chlamydomonas_euryale.AAC.8